MTSQTQLTKQQLEIKELKGKLLLSALMSIPAIIVMNPWLIPAFAASIPAGSYKEGLAWSAIALITVPVFMWCPSHLYLGAVARLKRGSVNLETIVALIIALASFFSLAITIIPGFSAMIPAAIPVWDYLMPAVALSLVVKISQVKKEHG